jgi:hypothetical protein
LERSNTSLPAISMMKNGLIVRANPNESWTVELFNLNGVKIRSCKGIGAGNINIIDQKTPNGFVMAKLKIKNSESVAKIIYR